MTCSYCRYWVVLNTSDKEYQKLHLLYKELYKIKENQGDIKQKRKEALESAGVCPTCGSIFREFMCQEEHICTVFKFCPICGNKATLSC